MLAAMSRLRTILCRPCSLAILAACLFSQTAIHAADPAADAPVAKDPALRRELLEMVRVDQEMRRILMTKGQQAQQAELEKCVAIDRRNTARTKEIVNAHGWPGKTLVGADGAHAAWLLVQHADFDAEFQAACLSLLEEAVKRGEAAAVDAAYLVDRVRVNQKKPQVYGTQFRLKDDGTYEPQPIEVPEHVDERRRSVGLGTLAEYAKLIGKPPQPAK
jgi:hypothetical protein